MSTNMLSIKEYSTFINDIPRFGLGIVFLWFGIDKFTLHDFYFSWFTSTERARIFLPTQDLSLSIYIIGVIELVLAALLFAGLKIRWISLVVAVFIILILLTAQYPSSFPQDIGLLGIAMVLILTNVSWQKNLTEKFLKLLWIMRYSIAAVLLLWAVDQIVNFDLHVGWLQLSSTIDQVLSANGIKSFLSFVILVELFLAGLIATGKVTITKYSLIALTIFFIFAIALLENPLNNHQTVGLAITTGWLAYIAHSKNRV